MKISLFLFSVLFFFAFFLSRWIGAKWTIFETDKTMCMCVEEKCKRHAYAVWFFGCCFFVYAAVIERALVCVCVVCGNKNIDIRRKRDRRRKKAPTDSCRSQNWNERFFSYSSLLNAKELNSARLYHWEFNYFFSFVLFFVITNYKKQRKNTIYSLYGRQTMLLIFEK